MNWDDLHQRLNKDTHENVSSEEVDSIWSAIEPEVDRINGRRRRKKVGWLFFALVGMLAFAGGLFLMNLNSNENSIAYQDKIKVSETDSKKIPSEVTASKDEKVATQQTLSTKDNRTKKETIIYNKKSASNEDVDFKTTTKIIRTNNSTTRGIASTNYKNINTKNIQTPAFKEQEVKKPQTIIVDSYINSNKTIASVNRSFTPVELLDRPFTGAVSESLKIDFYNKINNDASKPEGRLTLELLGGISKAKRDFRTIDTSNQYIIDLRNEYEKSLVTHHAGIRLQWQFDNGVYLGTGAERTAIRELLDFQDETPLPETAQAIERYALKISDNNRFVKGKLQEPEEPIVKKIYNSYNLWDVPLLLGFRQTKGKWSIGAEAGTFLNVHFRSKGEILLSDADFIDINTTRRSVGFGLHTAGFAERQLWNNLSIKASPFIRYYPSSLARLNFPIEQRYTLFGGNIGIIYKL